MSEFHEPWENWGESSGDLFIRDTEGRIVAFNEGNSSRDYQNYHRIVECVNFCAGSDALNDYDSLETALHDAYERGWHQCQKHYEDQKDAILGLLRDIVENSVSETDETSEFLWESIGYAEAYLKEKGLR